MSACAPPAIESAAQRGTSLVAYNAARFDAHSVAVVVVSLFLSALLPSIVLSARAFRASGDAATGRPGAIQRVDTSARTPPARRR